MLKTDDLREAFKRKLYDTGEYDPDSDLLYAAADELENLRERCEAYKGQVEAGEKEIERLRASLDAAANALTEAREWITKADKETWGYNHQGDRNGPGEYLYWPIRDELAHNLNAAIIAARKGNQQQEPSSAK